MDNFLLGMLVMWFTYPLLTVTREVIADKFVAVTMKSNDEPETPSDDNKPTMGFRLNGK